MSVEFIGMIHHRLQTEIHPGEPAGVIDLQFIKVLAEAHEDGGFDRVLVGYYGYAPDGVLVGQQIASHTKRLSPLMAHRPGFVSPAVAARKFATLDQIIGGRAAIHIVSGGDEADQHRDGDWLGKSERYERTDEYLTILKRLWSESAPVDHEGKYYHLEGASTVTQPLQKPRLPIYFGGASADAIAVAGKHADVYALWGETLEQSEELVNRVRKSAADHDREIGFSISFRPVLAATEEQAWARAASILERARQIGGHGALGKNALGGDPSIGTQRLLDAAAKGARLDKVLWTEIAALTGGRGNTTALVGTPDQVADALVEYHRIGATTFLIRGFDPVEDAVQYGAELIPLVKQRIAALEANGQGGSTVSSQARNA